MNNKIKVTIAREGLIIISFLLLFGLTYITDTYLSGKKKSYELNAQEIEVVKKGGDSFKWWENDPILGERNTPSNKINAISYHIILQFPKNTADSVIRNTISRDFPNVIEFTYIIWDSINNDNIKGYYDELGRKVFDSFIDKINLSFINFIFLFYAYPFYLLSRFVAWSITTLKQKKD